MSTTNVADSATDVTILAANASRTSAEVFNDSSADLYLLCANATSSATNFTAKLPAGGYFVVPFQYTGILKGIWSSAAGGYARVTETT